MDWGTIIIAVLTSAAFSGLVIYLIEIRPRRRQAEANANKAEAEVRKTDAEARVIDAEADNKSLDGAFRLIDVLTGQMTCYEEEQKLLKRRVSRLERMLEAAYRRIAQLMEGIKRLVAQIREGGNEPCWEPDDWEPREE